VGLSVKGSLSGQAPECPETLTFDGNPDKVIAGRDNGQQQ
jgi:hypothetical protein